MPSKVDQFWVEQVKELKAEHRDWGAPRLADAVTKRADQLARGDAPSERWISQWLRRDWPKIDEEERRQYTFVRWPESFEWGLLPWEAAPAVFELLRERRRVAAFRWGDWRSPLRLARWFYRVILA